jgi:hypothetical protein
MSDVVIFHELNHEQAFGHACIVCGRLFHDPIDQVPVGRSVTGDIVHACAAPRTCARDLGATVGGSGWEQAPLL